MLSAIKTLIRIPIEKINTPNFISLCKFKFSFKDFIWGIKSLGLTIGPAIYCGNK